jgi:lysyl-tRNA synthetase class 1
MADSGAGAADSGAGEEQPASGPGHRAFWADEVADDVEARVEAAIDAGTRDPDAPIVVKGGISPSGVPHLGNVNEIMRGYFIAECLRDRGHAVRQVFTTDDRDPLRSLPRTLANLDGELVALSDVDAGALGRNLGAPYTDIPDPFGCCDSYGDHFTALIERSAAQLGVPIDVVSTTDLYEGGDLEDVTRDLLANADRARAVLAEFQSKVDADYVPFNPICEACGRITETVTAVDPAGGTVDYRCTESEAGGETIEGCGHEGTATLREGKLPWRFEWPAQWAALGVDCEPFGKDHAEGSWPSGQAIAAQLLDREPPVPLTYEWFTLDGAPLSSSAGNVILVSDVLELIEPEVLRFFFAKDPSRGRDFSVERIDQLVDEFDRLERAYYREAEPTDPARTDRVYPLLLLPDDVPDAAVDREPPWADRFDPNDPDHRAARRDLVDGPFADRVRFPYTYAAVLGMFDDRDQRAAFARSGGHLPADAPDWAVDDAWDRVERAREWARRTDNAYNYRIAPAVPDTSFDEATAAALDELATVVADGADGEAIHEAVFEIARAHDLEPSTLFAAAYRLLFDREDGPRLGPFLADLDREFVVQRLRREA